MENTIEVTPEAPKEEVIDWDMERYLSWLKHGGE